MAHCGAKTRGGEPCKRHAVPGSARCKLHGGAASKANKANKHAAKPGSIYSQFLTDAENDMLSRIELGRVDDELRLTRIRLMRALNQENERGDTAELEARVEREGAGEYQAKTEEKYKVRDYSGLIDRLTGRIESLERTRAELLKTNPPELPPVTRIEIEVVGGRKDAAGANDAAAG
ncbi:HGGxSTG domain-containing protein [Pseudomonas sp. UMC65]|uniref:HGGxSTG domain-containing protein n=1 Tax=Pseudomonas sp. UMC65 TaxID=1862323 RepID=UPI00217F6B5F|nr:HGGxSTG domain-containing protein [Pseudomonas sp. UMC65]